VSATEKVEAEGETLRSSKRVFANSPTKLPRPRTAARRLRIVEDACKIFEAKGLEALTTRALARATGIKEGSLYRHFPKKRDVLLALVDSVGNRMQEYVETARRLKPTGVKDSVTRVGRLTQVAEKNARPANSRAWPTLLAIDAGAAGTTSYRLGTCSCRACPSRWGR